MAAKTRANETIASIASYKFGQSRKPLLAVEALIRRSSGNPDERRRISRQLAALLQSDATPDCKRFVCRQLGIIGTDKEVAALAKLLPDKNLSHMARYALQRIPGPKADAALREALGELKGNLRIGVINTIGERRDRRAVRTLRKLLDRSDAETAGAAAAALGKIGGRQAARALMGAWKTAGPQLKKSLADACLQCAERLLADGMKEPAGQLYKMLHTTGEPRFIYAAADRGIAALEK